MEAGRISFSAVTLFFRLGSLLHRFLNRVPPPFKDYLSKSSKAMILRQKTLPDMVSQAPVRSGKTVSTSLAEVDLVPRQGSRPARFAAKKDDSPLLL